MPQKDVIHNAVRNALIKDGWTIVADPYTITYLRSQLYADLCAERDEQEGAKRVIVVEVKSFRGSSALHDFHAALGQYVAYRDLLAEIGQPFQVYLAMSQEAYRSVFGRDAVQVIARREHLLLLVVDTTEEVVAKWID
jgi:XisH protein